MAREVGVSKHTIYAWKAKYGGMDVNEAQQAKQLRDENGKPIKIDQLWGIGFGDGLPKGANGRANQLFFTAGPSIYPAGTFGVIAPAK